MGETDWDKESVTTYEDYRVNNEPGSGTHITFYWNKANKADKIMVIYERDHISSVEIDSSKSDLR